MAKQTKRQELYANRVETALGSLLEDVNRWGSKLPEKSTIRHHVEQFGDFCQNALNCLMQDYYDGKWSSIDDELVFRSLVIKVFTSQWMALRQIAAQRLPASPYETAIKEKFDPLSDELYGRLRQALPPDIRSAVSPVPPLVYMGHLAQLTLFTQNQLELRVLSVPFSAMDDPRSAHSIPHEIGHAIFSQMPELFVELKDKLLTQLNAENPNRQLKVLHTVMMKWLEEIVADLVGATLGGPDFAESGLWITISPDALVGRTDKEHPVPLVRPYVYLEALDYLSEHDPYFGRENADAIARVKNKVNEIIETRLDRRFDSLPALTVMPLRSVKNELRKLTRLILDTPLAALPNKADASQEALQNVSIGEILLACASLGRNEDKSMWAKVALEQLPAWGNIPSDECQQISLKLFEAVNLRSPTPEASSFNLCWLIDLPGCP